MDIRFQKLSLVLSLMASLYVLVILVPSKVNGGFLSVDTNKQSIVVPAGENQPVPLVPKAVLPEFIQVKASGEPSIVEPELLSDQSLELFLKAKEELKMPFADPLDNLGQARPVHEILAVPPSIQEMVDYWEAVFGQYSQDQYIFSHIDDVSIVYGVLDMGGLKAEMFGMSASELEKFKQQVFADEKRRIRSKLSVLSQKMKDGSSLTAEERRLAAVFSRDTKVSLEDAANSENIRIQEGWSHRFKQAIINSGQYMQQMERIFASKGLPIELTRIPFVESAFNVNALSSAGARGMWQFIDSTGRMYLKMDALVDERLDPIMSTYAAADHLKNDYMELKSWPLAINAYNTGAGRMNKAKKQLGTDDIGTIIRKFDDPGYQFYSRNYYPEVVAAIHVYENREKYFGSLKTLPPLRYELFMSPDHINLADLTQSLDLSVEEMKKLNPALVPTVISGQQKLPRGYLVKVPHGMGKLFNMAAMQMRKNSDDVHWHMVGKGETVDSIAALYDVSVDKLLQSNRLMPGETVKTGALLTIPQEQALVMDRSETGEDLESDELQEEAQN